MTVRLLQNVGLLTVRGRFATVQAQAVTHGDAFAGAAIGPGIDVEIDAASIDTGIAKRDEHLRASDVLDVATFPTTVFHSTTVEDLADDRFRVRGDLIVHGIRRPSSLMPRSSSWTKVDLLNAGMVSDDEFEYERQPLLHAE